MLETAFGCKSILSEFRHDQKQPIVLFQPSDLRLEIELLEDVADLRRKALDVSREVGGDLVRLTFEFGEVELARIVERRLGDAIQNRLGIGDFPAFEFGGLGKHLLLRWLQDTVETTQHGQRQNDSPVLCWLVWSA